MKTLLEKAIAFNSKKYVSDITLEEYELAVAWAKGEVSLRQVQKALKFNNVNASYIFLSRCFKHVINRNP